MRLFKSSESYMEWDDYKVLIVQKALLDFLHETTLESYINTLQQEVVK